MKSAGPTDKRVYLNENAISDAVSGRSDGDVLKSVIRLVTMQRKILILKKSVKNAENAAQAGIAYKKTEEKYMPDTVEQSYRTDAAKYDMLYLVSCAVNGVMPDKDRVNQMDAGKVYSACKKHSLEAISFSAVEPLLDEDASRREPVMLKWKESKLLSEARDIMMDAERGSLFEFMEHKGIRYMPLKGIILKKMYPRTWQRQMSDNDIWFDKAFHQQVYDWFVARGYEAVSIGTAHDDIYKKLPFCSFELNRYMVEKDVEPVWTEYYSDVENRLLPQEGTEYGRRFSDEDFYIYMIVHAAAHVKLGGTGLRTVLDCFVFLKEKKETLDRSYIHRELKKLKLTEYEKNLRELSDVIFSDPLHFNVDALPEKQRRELDEILQAGTYGTMKKAVSNRIEEMKKSPDEALWKSKIRYCFRRIYPPMEYYEAVPFINKHRWLIPVYPFYRIARSLKHNGRHISDELRCIRNKKD